MRPLEERFWLKVHKGDNTACWDWQGATQTTGYGVITRGRLGDGVELAHRLAWAIANGRPVPAGSYICHKCDRPQCCNPAHLWLGSASDNSQDMAKKGRHGRAKLTPESVRAVREAASTGVAVAIISKRHGITTATVRQIVSRRTWRHVR